MINPCLAAQGTFLIGRRRLVNRRIDWLLYLLTTAVADQYLLRLEAQAVGRHLNIKQYAAMNAALLKAKGEKDDMVSTEDKHTANVQSRSDGQLYTVSLPQDASTKMPTCTCQAGVHRRMCWHVAKVLQLLGCSEHAMLRHMGLFIGSDQGGYWQLRAATDREQHASSDAPQPGTQQQPVSGVNDAEQPSSSAQRPQGAQTAAPCGSSPHVKTATHHKKEALQALSKLAACKDEWSDDSPNWRWLTVAVNQATISLHDMCSKTTLESLERSSSSADFAVNADALPKEAEAQQICTRSAIICWRKGASPKAS